MYVLRIPQIVLVILTLALTTCLGILSTPDYLLLDKPLKVSGLPTDADVCSLGCDEVTGWKFVDNLVSPKEPIAHSVLASAENKLISIQGENFASPAIATFRNLTNGVPLSFICIMESEKELKCSGSDVILISSLWEFSLTTITGTPINSTTKYPATSSLVYEWPVEAAWTGNVFTNYTMPINGTITNIKIEYVSGGMHGGSIIWAYGSTYGYYIVARNWSRDLEDCVFPFYLSKKWVYPYDFPFVTTDGTSSKNMINIDMTSNGIRVSEGELHTFGGIEDYYDISEYDNGPGTISLKITYTIVPNVV